MKKHRCIYCGIKTKLTFCQNCDHLSFHLKLKKKFDLNLELQRLFLARPGKSEIYWYMRHPSQIIHKNKFLKDSDKLWHLYSMSINYEYEGKYEQRLEALNEIYQQDNSLLSIIYEIGQTYQDLKDYDKAIESYLKILEGIYDFSLPTYVALIQCYVTTENYTQAIFYLEQLLLKRKHYRKSYLKQLLVWMAMIYDSLRNYDEGISYCLLALKEDSRYNLALRFLLKMYYMNDDIQALLEVCDKYLHKNINKYILWYFYAMGMNRKKEYEKSIEINQEILEAFPDDTNTLSNLAASYQGMGDFNKAEETYYQLLTKDDKNVNFLNNVSSLHFKKGEYDTAFSYINKALSIDPKYPLSWYNIAKINYKTKKISEAFKAIQNYEKFSSEAKAPLEKYIERSASELKEKIEKKLNKNA